MGIVDSCELDSGKDFRAVGRAGFYSFLVAINVDNLTVDEMAELFDEWMEGIFGADWEAQGMGFDFPMLLTMCVQGGKEEIPTFLKLFQTSQLRRLGLKKTKWHKQKDGLWC